MDAEASETGILERSFAVGMAAIPIAVLCLLAGRVDVWIGDPMVESLMLATFPAIALISIFASHPAFRWQDAVNLMFALAGATILLVDAVHLPMGFGPATGEFPVERFAALLMLSDYAAGVGVLVFLLFIEAGRRAFGWGVFLLGLAGLAGYLAAWQFSANEPIRDAATVALRAAGFPTLLIAEFLRALGGAAVFAVVVSQTGIGRAALHWIIDAVSGRRGAAAPIAVVANAAFGTVHGHTATSLEALGPVLGPVLLADGHAPHRAAAFLVCGAAGSIFMVPVLADTVLVWSEFVATPYTGLLVPCGIMAGIFFFGLLLQAHILSRSTDRKGGGGWRFFSGIGALAAFVAIGAVLMKYELIIVAAVGLAAVDTWRAAPGRRSRHLADLTERVGRRLIRFVVAVTLLGMIVDPMLMVSALPVDHAVRGKTDGLIAAFSALAYSVSGDWALGLATAAIATIVLGAVLMPHAAYILCVSAFAGFFHNFGVPVTVAHAFVFCLTVVSVFATPLSRPAFFAAALTGASPLHTAAAAAVLGSPLILLAVGMAENLALAGVGDFGWIVLHVALAVVGTVLWVGAMHGHVIGFGRVQLNSVTGWATRSLLAALGIGCFIADVSAKDIPWLAGIVAAVLVFFGIRTLSGFLTKD